MKKLALILSLSAFTLCLFAAMSCNSSSQKQVNVSEQPAEAPQTTLFKAVATANDVFPANCDTMGIAWGDLNMDGIKDVVIVAVPRLPEKMQTDEDGTVYNFNSPVMGIYFGKEGGSLTLFKEYENTIPGPEDETGYIEFGTEIFSNESVVVFDIEFFYMTNPRSTKYTFNYRYQDNDFYLVGADVGEMSPYGEGYEVESYNYLTHEKQTIITDVFDETAEPQETFTTIPEIPLEKLGVRLLNGIQDL